MLDFSKIEELRPLARLIEAVQRASEGLRFLLAGAQARDLLLKHAHGIETGRQTSDVDFAFRVNSWDEFLELRQRLTRHGEFEPTKTIHKLRFRKTLEIDIVPFGPIERSDRTIEWPPDGEQTMSLFGFREAVEAHILVRLPEGQEVAIVSLPGLTLLKFAAWRDRRLVHPGKDAHDLRLILSHYLDAGNAERLHAEFSYLLEDAQFDYELSGAFILGHDVGRLLDPEGRFWLLELLQGETNEGGSLRLVGDMRVDPEKGLRLLRSTLAGLRSLDG